jgi:hypothetical protein
MIPCKRTAQNSYRFAKTTVSRELVFEHLFMQKVPGEPVMPETPLQRKV